MKKSNPHRYLIPLLASFAALVSCVNPEYDLERIEVDEIALLKGAVLPLGSTEPFYLKNLLSSEDMGDDMPLSCDEDGNYLFKLEHQHLEQLFSVPDFRFEGYDEDHPHETTCSYPIVVPDPATLPAGVTLPEKTEPIAFDNIEFDVELDQPGLPVQIVDVRYADVTTHIVIKFSFDQSSIPFSRIMITEGTSIQFPEWVVLGEAPEGFVKNGNKLSASADFPIYPAQSEIDIPMDAMDFTKLPEGQGVSNGVLHVDDHVVVSGKVYVYSADCQEYGQFYPIITSYLHMDPMTIEYAEAKVDVSDLAHIDDQEIAIEGLPDMFTGDNVVLDLSGIRVNLDIRSSFPISGDFCVDLCTIKNGMDLPLWNATIGPVSIPAAADGFQTVSYSLSETGTGAPEGYVDLAVEGLDSILKDMPDKFVISNAGLETDGYGRIVPAKNYEIDLDYDLIAPLAFGEDLKFVYQEDIMDLGVSVADVDVAKAQLKFNVVSTIPLSFELSAQALDASGNVLSHIRAELDSDVRAGSLNNPSNTPVVLTLINEGVLEFDGIRLMLGASAGSDNAALNENQSLQLTDLALVLPEGISYTVPAE